MFPKLLLFSGLILFLTNAKSQAYQDDPKIRQSIAERRWSKSIVNLNFYKGIITDKNCESSFQVFAGCVLSLETYANFDSARDQISLEESESSNEKNREKEKNPIEMIYLMPIDDTIPKSAKILKEVGGIAVVRASEKEMSKMNETYLSEEELEKITSEELEKISKQGLDKTRQRLKKIFNVIKTSNRHVVEDLFKEVTALRSKASSNYEISVAVNTYLSNAKDPHSELLLLKTYYEEQEKPDKEYVGIGVSLRIDSVTRMPVIEEVFEGAGAHAAGLQSHDRIESIFGVSTQGLSIDAVVKQLTGFEGTFVEISVSRGEKTIPFVVKRGKVAIASVQSTTFQIDGAVVGYAKLTQFSNKEQCKRLEKIFSEFQTRNEILGAILDLRGNPGGYTEIAGCIAGQFIGEKKIIAKFVVNQSEHLPESINRKLAISKIPISMPPENSVGKKVYEKELVVLLNEDSASSSELLAAALRDYSRAYIVGNVSHGKGSFKIFKAISKYSANAQTAAETPEGAIGLLATSGLFYSPSGRTHQGTGLIPDIKVFSDVKPSVSEKITIRENDRYLFPLASNPIRTNFKANGNLVVPTSCVQSAGLETIFERQPVGSRMRDLQLLTAIQTIKCKVLKL